MARLWHINEGLDFESLFGPDDFSERPSITSVGVPQKEPFVLKMYRGFVVDPHQLEKRGNYLILSPHKSEQGLIWFTHSYIRGYDPLEYVRGRGTHLLTYPLRCIKHFQEVQWSDGTSSTKIPDEIIDKTNPYENCRFHMGIELPEGWVFSYKTEKFACCSVNLEITFDMLEKNE
jgi:hypothetical protein